MFYTLFVDNLELNVRLLFTELSHPLDDFENPSRSPLQPQLAKLLRFRSCQSRKLGERGVVNRSVVIFWQFVEKFI